MISSRGTSCTAITLAQAGRSVVVYEAGETVGGGSRTKELTLPGFRHDVCSAIHPLGAGSPLFRALPLERYGAISGFGEANDAFIDGAVDYGAEAVGSALREAGLQASDVDRMKAVLNV